jgi:hypothetical protein
MVGTPMQCRSGDSSDYAGKKATIMFDLGLPIADCGLVILELQILDC